MCFKIKNISLIVCLLIAFVFIGCGPKVIVPPEVDLTKYKAVGLINFESDAKGKLGEYVTQKFLQEISRSQKGVRIVELGDMERVLRAIDREELGPKAIQIIGDTYKVEAIIMGNLHVSEIKPKIDLSSIVVKALNVKADVDASLSVKLIETKNSATIWTNIAEDKRTVAQVSVFSSKDISFDAENPDEAYGELAQSLIQQVTEDLKTRRRRL
jgi:hypothetical protein